jgi:hypothetical protein
MCRGSGAVRPGASGAAGADGGGGAGAPVPEVAEMRFMDVARRMGRSGALGLAVGLYRRGRVRDLGSLAGGRAVRTHASGRTSRRAHRPGRARHAAAGGRVAALRSGPRARNHAGRGGTELGHPEGPPPRRRARGRLSGRRDHRGADGRRRAAQDASGCCRRAGRRCAREPRSSRPRQGGEPVGVVTSGGFAPSLGAPIALALIDAGVAADAALWGEVRGRRLPVTLTTPPFVAHRYHR